jgi:VanZ family protein
VAMSQMDASAAPATGGGRNHMTPAEGGKRLVQRQQNGALGVVDVGDGEPPGNLGDAGRPAGQPEGMNGRFEGPDPRIETGGDEGARDEVNGDEPLRRPQCRGHRAVDGGDDRLDAAVGQGDDPLAGAAPHPGNQGESRPDGHLCRLAARLEPRETGHLVQDTVAVVVEAVAGLSGHVPARAAGVRDAVVDETVAVVVEAVAGFGRHVPARAAGVRDAVVDEAVAVVVEAVAGFSRHVPARAAGIRDAVVDETVAVVVEAVAGFSRHVPARAAGVRDAVVDEAVAVVVEAVAGLLAGHRAQRRLKGLSLCDVGAEHRHPPFAECALDADVAGRHRTDDTAVGGRRERPAVRPPDCPQAGPVGERREPDLGRGVQRHVHASELAGQKGRKGGLASPVRARVRRREHLEINAGSGDDRQGEPPGQGKPESLDALAGPEFECVDRAEAGAEGQRHPRDAGRTVGGRAAEERAGQRSGCRPLPGAVGGGIGRLRHGRPTVPRTNHGARRLWPARRRDRRPQSKTTMLAPSVPLGRRGMSSATPLKRSVSVRVASASMKRSSPARNGKASNAAVDPAFMRSLPSS